MYLTIAIRTGTYRYVPVLYSYLQYCILYVGNRYDYCKPYCTCKAYCTLYRTSYHTTTPRYTRRTKNSRYNYTVRTVLVRVLVYTSRIYCNLTVATDEYGNTIQYVLVLYGVLYGVLYLYEYAVRPP